MTSKDKFFKVDRKVFIQKNRVPVYENQMNIEPSIIKISPKNINLEEKNPDELYNQFKILEKTLKTTIETSNDKNIMSFNDKLDEKFEEITKIANILLIKEIKFSNEKSLDRRIWHLFKLYIDRRLRTKSLEDFMEENSECLDKKINYVNNLLKQLIELNPDITNSEINFMNGERRLISSVFNFLGELYEFKDKMLTNGKLKDIQKITQYYFKAVSLYPYEGKYYMLLATCSYANNDNFSAILWSIRAFLSEQPFDTRENLNEFFERARKNYEQLTKNVSFSEQNSDEIFKMFLVCFLRYLYIFFTKISFEKISEVGSITLDYLQKFLKSDKKESTILSYIVQMIVFSIYYTIEGFDINEKNPEKKLQKTVEQMESNITFSECLKYSYLMISCIISNCFNEDNENSLNLILPIFYYISSYKNVNKYLFIHYPRFQLLLNKLLCKINLKITIDNDEESKNEENLLNIDKNLLGFLPLKRYFIENKTSFYLNNIQNQYNIKLKLLQNLSVKMGCDGIIEQQSINNISDDFLFLKEEINDFSILPHKLIEDKSKTLILIDGQNVALRHREEQFSSKALKIIGEFWTKKGYPFHILLPDFCFNKETIAKKRELANLPDDIDLLIDLKKRGFASGIPNYTYDDSFIIEYAKKKEAYIVSNDRYKDHIENYSKNDPKMREKLRSWIKNNCIK